jgi:RHS repeat-associated protein
MNPFRFSTKRTDPTIDLVLYEYRVYSPALGRWLSRDPIEEDASANLSAAFRNDPGTYMDGFGLYECRSEGFAARDPAYGMIWRQSESGSRSTCDAFLDHWAEALQLPYVNAICNSGADENTRIKIEVRDPCCREYRVTCTFDYKAKVTQLAPGTRPNRMTGINLNVNILGEHHNWHRKATKGSDGVWRAHLSKAGRRTRVIEVGPTWKTLLVALPAITAGPRDVMDGGKWLGARFDEQFEATCSFIVLGPCKR